jgi:hypothetical protein
MTTPLSLFDLVEAFGKPGCPVCRLTRKDVEGYLHSLLFEGFRFPENHERFRAGRGLCNAHAWQMADSFKGALLNIGVYYRGAVKNAIQALEAPPAAAARSGLARLLGGGEPSSAVAASLEPTGPCVACEIRVTSEKLYTRTIGEHITDRRLADAYRASNGVCLPHFRTALRYARGAGERELVAIQRGIWEALIAELDEFKEMHDHRHTGEWMGEEGDSWLRALRSLAGEMGMFGVDDSLD